MYQIGLCYTDKPRYVTRSVTRLSNTPAPSSLAPRYNIRSTSQLQSQQQPTTTSVPPPPQSLLSATSPLNTPSPATSLSQPPSSNSIKPGALRRLLLSRAASLRAKPHFTADKARNTIPVNNANFHYPTITPIKQTNEFSLTTALAMTGIAASKVIDATQAEMHKCLIQYGSFQPNTLTSRRLQSAFLVFYFTSKRTSTSRLASWFAVLPTTYPQTQEESPMLGLPIPPTLLQSTQPTVLTQYTVTPSTSS